MNKKEILELLAEVMGIDAAELKEISEDMALSEIGLDSIRFIEFIVLFEEKYDVEVYDSDLLIENFATIELMYKTLEKYFTDGKQLYKCIVTDCDGVLWKGIAGESGKDAAYTDNDTGEYQITLKTLLEKGVYICICSKNSNENIYAMFGEDIPLKLSDIAIAKFNVSDKSTAIKEIASELGISTESIVFVDDSSYELGLVSAIIPDITVVEADKDDHFVAYLKSLFDDIPEQSLNRTKLYREQKEREKIHITAANADEFNAQLQTKIDCGIASFEDLERISELSQRTNRFNMSGIRYSKDDIDEIMRCNDNRVFTLKASDIYGDMGLVAAAIVKENIIENFMLSCRVFGRGFEDVLINTIMGFRPIKLFGVYNETEKNGECREFYARHEVETL